MTSQLGNLIYLEGNLRASTSDREVTEREQI